MDVGTTMQFWVSQKAKNLQARVLLHGYMCVSCHMCASVYGWMCMLYVHKYVTTHSVAGYAFEVRVISL